jgi:hypothetical protein
MVSRNSVNSLQKKVNNKQNVELDLAIDALGETRQQFWSRWVQTGIVEVIDMGIRQTIRGRDLRYLTALKANYMTACEAGVTLNRGKHLLPNLEERGLINSMRLGKGGKIRLYSRSVVEEIVLRGLIPTNALRQKIETTVAKSK